MEHARQRKKCSNVFGQLRSLTILLTKEPARLQQQLDNPPSLDEDSARLVLKETHRDVKKLGSAARGHLNEMQDASSEFNNLLDACGKLVAQKKEKLEKIEQHLHKYGYTPYRSSKRKASDDDDKENRPELVGGGDAPRNDQSPMKDRLEKMPSLAEFGISQSTLAFLNKRGSKDVIDSRTQVFKQPIMTGKKVDEQDHPVSPFDQEAGVLVTPGIGLRMCESPYRMTGDAFASPVPPVFTTPRMKEMFSANKQRHPSMDETYVVKCSPGLTNPELPTFLTPSLQRYGKRQEEKLTDVPKMESLGMSSPGAPQMSSSRDGLAIPESPKLFACRSGKGNGTVEKMNKPPVVSANNMTKPPDQKMPASNFADDLVVPDTPEMTCTFRFKNINLNEKPPGSIPILKTSPEPVVPTTFMSNVNTAPETPLALNLNPMPPESVTKYTNNIAMPSPPRFFTETARRMFCDAELDNVVNPEQDTPRETITKQESGAYVQPSYLASAPSKMDDRKQDVQELQLNPGKLKGARPKRIAFITQDEYDQQPDYLQHTVSLETINKCVHKVNNFIRDKFEAGCEEDITSAELQNDLGFGNHAKKLILLLLQVKRVSQQNVGVFSIMD